MYKTKADTCAFFETFRPMAAASTRCDIVICPPFVDLETAAEMAQGTNIDIGGQNLFWAQEGAYTGEISGAMLISVGCRWVLIAHSERRQCFGETDAGAHRKICAAIECGLKPIVCVGEDLEAREAGRTHSVLEAQFNGGIAPLRAGQFSQIAIAYEPVWAIGTGRTATPDTAAGAHRLIRELIRAQYGPDAAGNCRILYGGSVKPDNIKDLMAEEDIDGALVGGASLDPVSFASILHY